MRRGSSENANTNTLVGEMGYERPPATVTAGVTQSRQLVEPAKHFDEAVG